ncbi:MAG: hypothetical protein ACRD0Y_02785, partial [Terriglobales bacterium]
MKQKLELALSVLVIIFAVFLVIGFLRSGLAPWDHPLIPEVAHPGDILPPIAGLNANPGQTTLIVAIRKGCEFCEASMPFYRRLEDLEKEHKLKPRLLAVLPGSEATA